jgi:hypothetical protein
MKRLLHEQFGPLLLLATFVWVGLAMALFPVRPVSLPGAGQLADYRQKVGVAYARGELAPEERVFPKGKAEDYRREDIGVFTTSRVGPPPPPPELPLPTCARVRRPPQLLPEPGPTLEGADKLPRWGSVDDPVSRRPGPAR